MTGPTTLRVTLAPILRSNQENSTSLLGIHCPLTLLPSQQASTLLPSTLKTQPPGPSQSISMPASIGNCLTHPIR